MVALTSIIIIIVTRTLRQLFSPLRSIVCERGRERDRKGYDKRSLILKKEENKSKRDAYGSYHESCTFAMSHFTIKWKAKESRQLWVWECIRHTLTSRRRRRKIEIDLTTNGKKKERNKLDFSSSRSFTSRYFLSNHWRTKIDHTIEFSFFTKI